MITEQDRQKAEQLIAQAKHAASSGDHTQARRLASAAARLNPESEQPWLLMASMATPSARAEYYRKALSVNPKSIDTHKGLLHEEQRMGQSNDAPTQPTRAAKPPEWKRTIFASRRKAEARSPKQDQGLAGHPSTFTRVAQYTLVRGVALVFTLVVSLFLIIYIVNLGGYLDTITKGEIAESLAAMGRAAAMNKIPPEQIQQMVEQARGPMEEALGLHQPFILRCARWLYRGLTFQWGQARSYYVISTTFSEEYATNDIHELVQAYLPRTLLLLGVSNLGIFLISILLAVLLTRSPGNWINKIVMALAPTSAAPGWVYGLILYALSYKVLGIYNLRLGVSSWPSTLNLDNIPAILRGLALPFLAIFISKFFQSVYAWRTYFLVYSREDYVELARAKGLPNGVLERRYLMRPALPGILTAFALIIISLWQECIAVEYFFNIQGIGGLFAQALSSGDVPIVVALTSIFAYFLAITVFFLEILYALIDPRVRLEKDNLSRLPRRIQQGYPGAGMSGMLRSLLSWPARSAGSPSIAASREKTQPLRTSRPHFQERAVRAIANRWESVWRAFQGTVHEMASSPMAISGMVIVLILTAISIYTMITIPYGTAIRQWRGDDNSWIKHPVEAPPRWVNLFLRDKLPETIQVNSQNAGAAKAISTGSKGARTFEIRLPFDYAFDTLPQDIMVLFSPHFKANKPFVQVSWITPDGREIPFKNFSVTSGSTYYPGRDETLKPKWSRPSPIESLFFDPSSAEVLKGRYTLKISGFLFEPDSDLDAELVVFGKVYGIAGTDSHRRDLSLILLWGTVIALTFGIIASVGTTLLSVILAAVSAWFGGWVDGLIQRVTEINMVLPVLPVSILVFYLYSKSFWVLLGVVIGLNIFGNALKNYRAIFLQFISAPYIEAARAYGATNWRIITQYLIPRIRTVFIPQFIILVPSYIFLEATLAFLGVSDPTLPTLGKLILSTMRMDIFSKPVYLTMEPFGMLIFIGLGFALLGFALERAYNERAGI